MNIVPLRFIPFYQLFCLHVYAHHDYVWLSFRVYHQNMNVKVLDFCEVRPQEDRCLAQIVKMDGKVWKYRNTNIFYILAEIELSGLKMY